MFSSLNERQIAAATTTEGKVKIVAGAGSGKTRVLAHRYAYLVNDIGISPSNILCMTFTNKAAQEMKKRISGMVDCGSVNDFICTIHGFCVKFLRREIYRIGYPKNFTVMDEEDGKVLAKQAMEEFGIDRRKTTAERFLRGVAALKGYDPDAYIQLHLLPNGNKEAPDATVRYIQLQLKQFALDFDDLLYLTVYIMEHFDEAREYWTDKINYIMVDEVQDCSADDWRLLRLIASKHHNLFVVGDPDQAIYEWRGAKPKLFVDFAADSTIILDRNYRSTPQVLNLANAVIANNHNRIPKDLYTSIADGPTAVHYHAKTEKEECEWIADRIVEAHKNGAKLSETAVLFRSSFLSRTLEQVLMNKKIAYSLWGGVRFFERKEIKDTLSYLRLIANTGDDAAFSRIINIPSRKFGKSSMEKLMELAEKEGRPLYLTLASHIDDAPFNKPALRGFISLMEEMRLMSDMLSVSELTDEVLKRSGLLDHVRNDEKEERLENVNELVNSMLEYESQARDRDDKSLAAYLQDIALYTNADYRNDGDTVRLMTIHQAKGLEFDSVFVMGLSEGVFPNHRSIRERRNDGEEEERRLMYVAVTRARHNLYLTDSEGHMPDSSAFKYPSRYFGEIPEPLLVHEGCWRPELIEGTRMMMRQLSDELGGDSEEKIPVGARVMHKIFGEGMIMAYDKTNDSYKVSFEGGTRNLLARAIKRIDS